MTASTDEREFVSMSVNLPFSTCICVFERERELRVVGCALVDFTVISLKTAFQPGTSLATYKMEWNHNDNSNKKYQRQQATITQKKSIARTQKKGSPFAGNFLLSLWTQTAEKRRKWKQSGVVHNCSFSSICLAFFKYIGPFLKWLIFSKRNRTVCVPIVWMPSAMLMFFGAVCDAVWQKVNSIGWRCDLLNFLHFTRRNNAI